MLSLVAKHADSAVLITNEERKIDWCNDSFTRITGYTLAEAIGRNPGDLLQGPKTDPQVKQVMRDAVRRLECFRGELINYRKDGQPYWADIEIQPVFNHRNRLSKFVAIQKDVTAIKRVQEEKEAVQRQLVLASREAGKAEIAAGVIHNVGNVLNSTNVSVEVIGELLADSHLPLLEQAHELIDQNRSRLAQFVSEDPQGQLLPDFLHQIFLAARKDQQEIGRELAAIQSSVEHIKQIVASHQNLAMQGSLQMECDLREIVEQCLTSQGSRIQTAQAELKLQVDAAPVLQADPHLLMQILVNLIANAADAVQAAQTGPGRIRVHLYRFGGMACVSIEDNGIGILPEDQGHLFQFGFTTKKQGHGFGLHSSSIAARQLGGSLEVFSEGRNRGARFVLQLPMHPAERDSQATPLVTSSAQLTSTDTKIQPSPTEW